MTAQEADAFKRDLEELRLLVRSFHERAHDLVQALQVPLSELDLAVLHLRKAVEDFYERHPELQ